MRIIRYHTHPPAALTPAPRGTVPGRQSGPRATRTHGRHRNVGTDQPVHHTVRRRSRMLVHGESVVASAGIALAAILLGLMAALAWWTVRTERHVSENARVEQVNTVAALLGQSAEAVLGAADRAALSAQERAALPAGERAALAQSERAALSAVRRARRG